MFELDQSTMLNSQVGALKECIDLCRNGYFIRVQHFCNAFWFIKLRHYHNGRELTIWWEPGGYEIKEKGKLLKRQIFPNDYDAKGKDTKE